jgi:nucleoid DNA-binding protein
MEIRETIIQLAQKSGVTPRQAKAVLQAQAELAYEYANVGYPIAGIGIFTKVERPARELKLVFGPKAGESVMVPAKQAVRFRIAAIASEIVLRPGSLVPDVTQIDLASADGSDERVGD